MAQISLLGRDLTVRFPAPLQAEEVVAVHYATSAMMPRSVYLPPASYRPATAAELAASPRLKMIPATPAALQAEQAAIAADLKAALVQKPSTFTVP